MKTVFGFLDQYSAKFVWRLCLISVLFLGAIDTLSGTPIIIEPFFFLPITIASWYGSRKSGLILAITTTALLVSIHILYKGLSPADALGYGLPYLMSFSGIALLITNFRKVHRAKSIAADTDSLTKVSNARSFHIILANELLRSSRYEHVFSLAYLDIDNFKIVNDTYGHAEGDKLLIAVAESLTNSLRATDIVARIGGDEFSCLLPETKHNEARSAFRKASGHLKKSMLLNAWPVSFSIGLVTFETTPKDIKEAMKIADDLMYSVKNKEKNNICHKIWYGETVTVPRL